jgi:SAM-dependent methyltransferase
MTEALQRETERLTKSWMRHNRALLRGYLVTGVEDPRLNVQSILTRHFLIEALFGSRFAALERHELQFALAMNWLRRVFRESATPGERCAVQHGLRTGADDAEGVAIPLFAAQTFAALPARANGLHVPNYLHQAFKATGCAPVGADIPEDLLETFARLWRRRLAHAQPARVSVLEPGCGSANDYRFIAAYGIAPFIQYEGFDLCEKNVHNARAMFPAAQFKVGNIFEIPASDKAYDFCFVHDLFEHLSPEGIETAISEICRVTRQGACLAFFNMDEIDDHVVRPVEDYHLNTLSMIRLKQAIESHSGVVRVVHIGTFIRTLFGVAETHNRNAYTFFVAF